MDYRTIKCPNCGKVGGVYNSYDSTGLICSNCYHRLTEEETTDQLAVLANQDKEKELAALNAVNKRCVPVLKTEGWLFYITIMTLYRLPKRALGWLWDMLERASKYINWCIGGSIFRMGILYGAPVYLIISTWNIINFMWVHTNDTNAEPRFTAFFLYLVVCIVSVLAWVIAFEWVRQSNSPDIKLVRKTMNREK